MKNLIALSALLLALSCASPSSMEQFQRGAGPYTFSLDMTDTLVTAWDIDLYTRVDALQSPAEMGLQIAWKAPSDSIFTETVYLPLQQRGDFFSFEAYAPYRSGVVPGQPGIWTLEIAVPEPPEGLRGMGIVLKRR